MKPEQSELALGGLNTRKQTKRGMLWVDRVASRGSCAILTQNFLRKCGESHKQQEKQGGPPRRRRNRPGGSLLDGNGQTVYTPIPDRGEPLTKPVELPQGTLEMLILKAVSLGSLHGYGILLRIQQISGERLEILQGSFYTAIYRLERRGWIRGEWGESENNRRARFYSLTAAGTRQLKTETTKWTDMAAVVAGILNKKADEL